MDVLLYARPECPLCDEARGALSRGAVEFDEVDVTGDAGLEAEYGQYVPVVEVSGRIVFHAGMDPGDLPRLVRESL